MSTAAQYALAGQLTGSDPDFSVAKDELAAADAAAAEEPGAGKAGATPPT
jgi:hypothetical protein